MRRSSSRLVPLECDEQVALAQWLDWSRIPYFAIPNGGDRHPAVAAKLKAEGVKAGVPDLFLPIPRGAHHGLFVEMKRQRGGKLSDDQKDWIIKLQAQGYEVKVCAGFEAAKAAIEEYLSCPKT